MKTHTPFTRAAIAGAAAFLCASGHAAEWQLDDGVKVKLNSTVTLGTAVRTESPDPAVLGAVSTARLSMTGYELGGNAGGSDLNFKKNRPVSTVLKGLFNLEVSKGNMGVNVSAHAWTDHELENGNRAYGNFPNGFARDVPLSDAGFDPRARFSNAVIDNFNVFGQSEIEGRKLDWRVGRQVLSWGQAQFIGGGLNVVNPVDAAAVSRPGALPEESRIPVGMLHGKVALNPATSLEGWAQYEFRPSVLNGCGTFFSAANYAPTGCNFINVSGGSGINDQQALASTAYPKRTPDQLATDAGQFGLSLGHRMAEINTDLRVFAMNYHSRTPFVRVTNPNIAGTPGNYGSTIAQRLINANGVKYGLTYAENIQMLGGSFSTALSPATRVYGELSYRPNQPIQLNASDMIAAFLQRDANTALQLAKNTNGIAPGTSFDGFDRFKVSTLALGGSQVFAKVAGASRVVLAGEVGTSHVAGLPSADRLRYGRSDEYGSAAVANGAACGGRAAPIAVAAAKTCAYDGYVTSNSWGYRVRVAGTYPAAFMGATLTPSFTFAHDVKGYSHDGVFLEGRKTLRPALRADWGTKYFADLIYNRFEGGKYFTLVDRDTLSLSAGMRF